MDRNVGSFISRARIGAWALLALLPGRPAGAAPSDLPPAPPPRAAPAARPAAATPVAGVKFSFDQADIRLIIRLAGEVTGRRFVVDEKVAGTVTVIAPEPVPREQVYPLLLSILESRGFSVVEREGACFVVPLAEAAAIPVAPVDGQGGGLTTRIYRPKYVDATVFAKVIEPLVRGGKAGAVTAFGPTNQIVITDTAAGLRRIEQILAQVDQPGTGSVVDVVALTHAAAEDLAEQLNAALGGAESAGTRVSRHIKQMAEGAGASPAEVMVIPSAQANRLVLVGTPVQIAELKRLIAELDVEPASGSGRLNAVFLKYLSAEEAAKSLNALLAKTVDKDQRQRIAIEPSISNNALLVDASPRDFQWVQELLAQLDIAPQQVLVEVVIAEVGLDKQVDLGVDWSTIHTPKNGALTGVARSRPGAADTALQIATEGVFPQGLSIGLARGGEDGATQLPLVLKALQNNRDVRILSSVPLWAQNNAAASVNVVDNIPVLRSTIQGGSGTSRDVIQNIERMDVGIKLKITPRVNPDNEITLVLNPSIESVVDKGPSDTNFAPTIARRDVSTTVTVADRSTVVITGLIREDRIQRVSKVPLLGDIPLIGFLFRHTSDSVQRSNLLIFVTPRIVTDEKAAARLRDELSRRTTIPVAPPAAGRIQLKPLPPDGARAAAPK